MSLFVDLSGKLISNNFTGAKMDFRFHKKSEQLALMPYSIQQQATSDYKHIALHFQNVIFI